MPNLVTGRGYRAKVHWRVADVSTVVPVNPLFLRANAICSANSLCLSCSTLFFVIFDSFTFYLAFFLTHNLLPIFSILNPTYLCLGKECIGLYARIDSPKAVLQHAIQIMLDHISEHLKYYEDQEGLW